MTSAWMYVAAALVAATWVEHHTGIPTGMVFCVLVLAGLWASIEIDARVKDQ